MSTPPVSAERREAILEAATSLFATHGYDGASLDAIIERSQTSKGTLYHYFQSKEELYSCVLERMLEQIWEQAYPSQCLEEADASSFWPLMVASWRRSVEHMGRHPEHMALWRTFQEQWRALGDAGPTRRLKERSLQMSSRIAARGQQLGCLRQDLTPRQCAQLIDALDMVTDEWFFAMADERGARAALERQGGLTLDLIWRLLCPASCVSPSPDLERLWGEASDERV